jgi:hypothetical protein
VIETAEIAHLPVHVAVQRIGAVRDRQPVLGWVGAMMHRRRIKRIPERGRCGTDMGAVRHAGRRGGTMETGSDPGNDGPYWLAAHVYFALCAHHAVLMDLRHDRYQAVQPAEALAGWVQGWPLPGVRTAPAPPIVRRLLAQGLLVRDARRGRMAVAVSAREPTRTLLEFDFANRQTAGARAAADLARAWAAARLWLALFSMQTVLGRVGARGAARSACRGAWDWDRAHALVMRFVHLRPLFYTARDACLLDSLTLLNFLALHDVYPQWVFGVRTAPFHAHCWVQQEDVLYNDMPERVRQYTPILRI